MSPAAENLMLALAEQPFPKIVVKASHIRQAVTALRLLEDSLANLVDEVSLLAMSGNLGQLELVAASASDALDRVRSGRTVERTLTDLRDEMRATAARGKRSA